MTLSKMPKSIHNVMPLGLMTSQNLRTPVATNDIASSGGFVPSIFDVHIFLPLAVHTDSSCRLATKQGSVVGDHGSIIMMVVHKTLSF